MSQRTGMISSMAKRSWGSEQDEDDSGFAVTEEDWPASPEKIESKPTGGFSNATSSKPVQIKSIKAPTLSKVRSSTSSTSSSSRTIVSSSSKSSSAKIHPMFSQAGSSTSSSTSNAVAAPKKRSLPWENLPVAAKVTKTSNFSNIDGSSSVVKSMLTSSTMDIKQKVLLSPEQQMVLKLVVEDGKNVFFTGSAGTGKSVLLREIIAALRRKHSGRSDAVAVTASTGMAACNIGGTTIHSFSGIGLGTEPAEQLISKVKKNRGAAGKWARTLVLVVDEVSMVDGILFDKLAAIACALRKKQNFGGIQLVVTGDFFQLPPVTKGSTPTFAFEAKSWKSCIHHTVNLTQVFRQKDTVFIDMLNEMRFGTLTPASIARFKALSRVPDNSDGIDPTELFPMRNEVERANQARLAALPGEPIIYEASDWSGFPDGKNTYLENFMAQKRIVLKLGAQVMLIKNLDIELVNGTVGKVVGFGPVDDPEEEDGEAMGGKSELEKDKKLAGVKASAPSSAEMFAPQIAWSTPNGIKIRTMAKEEFKVEDVKGQLQAKRTQYPLILAWAMSIHKSQGQTIPRVKVNLGRVFEKGQSYVALSRATCLDGLQVIGFDAQKVMAHPKVTVWSKTLTSLN